MSKKRYVDVSPIIGEIDYSNISQVLEKYQLIHFLIEELTVHKHELEDVVKAFLKERKWKNYTDLKTKIPVNLTNVEKRTVNEKMLAVILTEEQLNSVISKKKKEVVDIGTRDKLARLKKCIK